MILCESIIDALTFWCAGFRHVTASYGIEGFTPDHPEAFQRHGIRRVVIAYDRDDAGETAAGKLATRLLAEGMDCYRIQFPRGMDANTYACKLQPAGKSLELVIRKAVCLGNGSAPQVELSATACEQPEQAAAKEEITEPAASEADPERFTSSGRAAEDDTTTPYTHTIPSLAASTNTPAPVVVDAGADESEPATEVRQQADDPAGEVILETRASHLFSPLTMRLRRATMPLMPRVARVVDVPHHVTQCGNNRQDVFFVDDDRRAYLAILAAQSARWKLAILGYCLMGNHVHVVAIPRLRDSLAKALGRAHWIYSLYVNRLQGRSGHLWQNRFYSAPMDDEHCLAAMRYVECNPLRARICRNALRYPWSSAAAHGSGKDKLGLLDLKSWEELAGGIDWEATLADPLDDWQVQSIGRATRTGRPLASDRFIAKLETVLGRRLRPLAVGRPRKRRPVRRKRKEK